MGWIGKTGAWGGQLTTGAGTHLASADVNVALVAARLALPRLTRLLAAAHERHDTASRQLGGARPRLDRPCARVPDFLACTQQALHSAGVFAN
jgi:hypothetical protein